MNGIFVGTDGLIEVRNYDLPLRNSVEKDVGGYIERVTPRGLPRGYMFFCNEEGLIEDLPTNQIATKLYQFPRIAGNVVIFREGMTANGIDCVEMNNIEIIELLGLLNKIKEG